MIRMEFSVLTVITADSHSLIQFSKEPVWKLKFMYGPRVLLVVGLNLNGVFIQTVLI